jgi:hypothetical protein
VLRLGSAYAMVTHTLDYLVKTVGIEVLVVHPRLPFTPEARAQLLDDVEEALCTHNGVRLAIFSQLSSVVRELMNYCCVRAHPR